MEMTHPGLIEAGKEKQENLKMKKEFTRLSSVDEGKACHTPEYDQVSFISPWPDGIEWL